jgi:hypothetical protein
MFTVIAPQPADRRSTLDPSWLPPLLFVGVLLSLVAQAWLAFTLMINADELHFFSQVYSYLQGTLDVPLQTFYVHIFAPLAALPGNEIQQLVAGRLAMLAFECVSLVSLYMLARAWSAAIPSLAAVLAFATMSLTIVHGASFRADPLALALILAALAVLARAPIRAPAVFAIGLLAAVAFVVTIKVVFFAPAFAGIAAWRMATSDDRRRTGMAMAAIAGIAAVATVILYLFHQASLQLGDAARSKEVLTSAASVTIMKSGFLPGPTALFFLVMTSPLQVLLILATIVTLAVGLARGDSSDRWRLVAMAGCVAPLLSLLFYRNSFGYFIPTISGPAFAAVAWFIERQRWRPALLAILGAGMLATGALSLSFSATRDQSEQRTTVIAVHQMFPKPVPYIDASGMIATFPRRGFFMTGWGIAEYRRHPPVFEKMLREEPIPLLLVNGSPIEHALGLGPTKNGRLLPEDQRVLRENYIPHWGPVWVAGKRIRLPGGPTETTIQVPGRYTIEGASVVVDGREYRPGDTVLLSRGTPQLAGPAGSEIILRWGDRLVRPSLPEPINLTRGF